MAFYQKYHLNYPLDATQVANLDEMLGDIASDMTLIAATTSIPGAQGSRGLMGVAGLDGDDGDLGLPGLTGVQGIAGVQGLLGPAGFDGEDADTGIIAAGVGHSNVAKLDSINTFTAGALALGVGAAVSGNIRVKNNTTIIAYRKADDSRDYALIVSDIQNNAQLGAGGDFTMAPGTGPTWDFTGAGPLQPRVDNAYDIGTTSLGARVGYFRGIRVGPGTTAATAYAFLAAGTTAAGTAPLKFNSGSLMTTPEAGAVEFLTDAFYGTITTGAARKTFAFLDSNITGSAAKWTTARLLAGNSVDGSANVAFANKVIVQGTTDSGLSAAQFLGALDTGIVKNTTTTGVLTIAIAADFPTLNQNTTGTAATVTGATQASITSAANLATVGTITSGVWNAGALTSRGALTINNAGAHIITGSVNSSGQNFTLRNTNGGSAAASYLAIGNDTDAVAFYIQVMSSTFTPSGILTADSATLNCEAPGGYSLAASNASGTIRYYTGGSTRRALIDTDGTFTMDKYGAGTATFSAAGVISSVSDERMKDINGPLGYGLAEVLALEPIRYCWNGLSGLDDPLHTEYGGFGAAAVKKIMPLAVGENQYGYLTFSDRPIIGALVNGMKELNFRLEALEKRM